jgi:hypothetical protein
MGMLPETEIIVGFRQLFPLDLVVDDFYNFGGFFVNITVSNGTFSCYAFDKVCMEPNFPFFSSPKSTTSSGALSFEMNPSDEKYVNTYIVYYSYMELGTTELFLLESTYTITVTPDTSEDSDISEEFKALKKSYDDEQLDDNQDKILFARIKSINEVGLIIV